jgi:uncharacterized protein YndB with AHSA1/START domain
MSDAIEAAAGRTITAEMRTAASPQAAYDAWADPARLAQWFVDRASGEVHAGGAMTWVWEAFGMEVRYDVVEVQPGRRLVLRAPPHVAPPGVIEITIRREQGETVLTIVNSGFLDGPEWDELVEGVRSGWTLALAVLKEYLEHYASRSKRTFVHMQPAQLDFDTLLDWFTQEPKLQRWLTTSGAPRAGVFPLVFRDGVRAEARVIARTTRELALALPAQEAVLELKGFTIAAPPSAGNEEELPPLLRAAKETQQILCIRGTCWSADPARFEWLRHLSAQALDRLVNEVSA